MNWHISLKNIEIYDKNECFNNRIYLECNDRSNETCLRNGIEVLEQKSYNTNLMGVARDFFGLIALGLFMHILAFIGIRRYVRSAGYY